MTNYDTTIKIALVIGILSFMALFIGPPIVEDAQAIKENSRGPSQYYDGTVSSMSGETHIYNFGDGITPTVPYIKFYNRVTEQGYDSSLSKLIAKASIVWADSEVLLTDETLTVGGWLIPMPTQIQLPNGWYDVMIYERVGATPAFTDTKYLGRSCKIYNGEIISFDNR